MSGLLVDTKRKALEKRRTQLLEEYVHNSAQLDQTLLAGDRLKIKRVLEALEADLQDVEQQIEALPKQLADVLKITMGRGGFHPHKAGPGQWWVRLKIESNTPVTNCRGQIYDIFRLAGETDLLGIPLPESQTSILSWADDEFQPISLQSNEPRYLDLAWRAHADPPIPEDELRVASARNLGKRNTKATDWSMRQDFIPLKPGHYMFIVRVLAEGYDDPLKLKYRLQWPGPGREDDIRLLEFP